MTRFYAGKDSVPVSQGFFNVPNGRFKIGHHNGPLEAVTHETNHVLQNITVTEVMMEIVGKRDLNLHCSTVAKRMTKDCSVANVEKSANLIYRLRCAMQYKYEGTTDVHTVAHATLKQANIVKNFSFIMHYNAN